MLNCRNSIEFAGFENANQSTAILKALGKAIMDTLRCFSRCACVCVCVCVLVCVWGCRADLYVVLSVNEIVFVGKKLPHLTAGTTLPVPMRLEKPASRYLPVTERGVNAWAIPHSL